MSEEKQSNDIVEGIGCILFVIAIVLAIILLNITPELIAFIERKLQ